MISIPKKLRENKALWLLCFAGIAGLAFASYKLGAKADIRSDFAVFWEAGNNYRAGNSLYQQVGGACRYLYPPFAAMLFQIFSFFDVKIAGAIYAFINFFLWAGIFYYTKRLLELCNISRRQITISLVFGFILSLRYFWYHMFFIQMNELVLFLSLAGVTASIEKKNGLAMFLLILATFIKIIPVFLLIWAISKSNWKTALYALLFSLGGIALPFLMRGMHNGMQDLNEYYQTFLAPFKNGRVEPEVENNGLSAALYKMFSHTDEGVKYGYIVAELPADMLRIIATLSSLVLLLTYVVILLYSRFIRKSISLLEISFILLFTHLISGITWEYHLVSLGFVITVLIAQFLNASKSQRYIYYPLLAFVLLNDIIGMSTVGRALFYKSCGYSLLTILMLIVAIFQVYCYFSKSKNYPVVAG